jgi:hypothetical protein
MLQMSSTMSAQALHMGETWPFVTVPSFEAIGSGARKQAGLETIIFAPLVNREQAKQWGSYSAENLCHWINESEAAMRSEPHHNMSEADYSPCQNPLVPFIFDSAYSFEEMSELGLSSLLDVRDAEGLDSLVRDSTLVYDGPYLPYW